jgi:hypothetical protein
MAMLDLRFHAQLSLIASSHSTNGIQSLLFHATHSRPVFLDQFFLTAQFLFHPITVLFLDLWRRAQHTKLLLIVRSLSRNGIKSLHSYTTHSRPVLHDQLFLIALIFFLSISGLCLDGVFAQVKRNPINLSSNFSLSASQFTVAVGEACLDDRSSASAFLYFRLATGWLRGELQRRTRG